MKTMKNFILKSLNKAISTPIAIIVIIVIAFLGIGVVLAYQYWWIPEKTPEGPTDKTANWEIYRNEEYRFEIKHPIGTKIGDIDINGGREVWMQPPFLSEETKLNSKTLHIRIVTTQFNYGVEQPAKCTNAPDTQQIVINEIDFNKNDISNEFIGTQNSSVATEYCTMKGNKAFKIVTELRYNRYSQLPDFDTEKESEVFYKMLSTFRFIGKNLNHEESEVNHEEPEGDSYCLDSEAEEPFSFYKKGTASSDKRTCTDECIDKDNLKEYFCAFGKIVSEEFRCPNGCEDGHCVSMPTISILSPNGKEKWQYGNNYTIKWESKGINKIKIYLEDWEGVIAGDNYKSCVVADNIPASSGKYSWTIKNCPISTGDSFIMRIVDVRGVEQGYSQQAEARSYDYFSIE